MANTPTLSTLFTDIANAIRVKTGKTEQIQAAIFPTEIRNISTQATDLNNLIVKPNTGGIVYKEYEANVADDWIINFDDPVISYDNEANSYDIKYIIFNYSYTTNSQTIVHRKYKLEVTENNITNFYPIDGLEPDTINSVKLQKKVEYYKDGNNRTHYIVKVTVNITPSEKRTLIDYTGLSGILVAEPVKPIMQPIKLPYTMFADDILAWTTNYYGHGVTSSKNYARPEKTTDGLLVNGTLYFTLPNEYIPGLEPSSTTKMPSTLKNWQYITIQVKKTPSSLNSFQYAFYSSQYGLIEGGGISPASPDQEYINYTIDRSKLTEDNGKYGDYALKMQINPYPTGGEFILQKIQVT